MIFYCFLRKKNQKKEESDSSSSLPPLGVKSGQATADVGSPSAIVSLTEGQLELCRKLSNSNKNSVEDVAKSLILAFKNQNSEYVFHMSRTFFLGLDTTAREELTA